MVFNFLQATAIVLLAIIGIPSLIYLYIKAGFSAYFKARLDFEMEKVKNESRR